MTSKIFELVLSAMVVLTSVTASMSARTGGLVFHPQYGRHHSDVRESLADIIQREKAEKLQEQLFEMLINDHNQMEVLKNRIKKLENSFDSDPSDEMYEQTSSQTSDSNPKNTSTLFNNTRNVKNNYNLNENSHQSFVKFISNTSNTTEFDDPYTIYSDGIFEDATLTTDSLYDQDDYAKLGEKTEENEDLVRHRRSVTEVTMTAEHHLVKYLFDGYNKNIRPVDNHTSMVVEFQLALFNIVEMDTRNRILRLNCEMMMKWIDTYLQWDPKDFAGVSVIRVPYYNLWTPDIILHNTAESDYEATIMNTFAIIEHTGEVSLLSHAFIAAICDVDVQYYPFDQQTCVLKFSSWTYDTTEMDIIGASTTLGYYTANPEFFLEDFWSTIKDEYNECCPTPFSTVRYYIQFQRRTKFALFFYIMPGILINICAVMVFALPAESEEKIGLGINALIAMIVFLMAMTDNIPPTQKLPLAGIYYGVCLAVITANIMFSVFILNVHFRGMRGFIVPPWLKTVSVFLAKMLGVRIPSLIEEKWDLDDSDDEDAVIKLPPTVRQVSPIIVENGQVEKFNISENNEPISSDQQLRDPFQRRTVQALEGILRIIESQDDAKIEERKAEIRFEEWKFVSRVLDRFLFVTFALVALLFNVIILTNSPYYMYFEFCPYGHNDKKCSNLTELEKRNIITWLVENNHHKGFAPDSVTLEEFFNMPGEHSEHSGTPSDCSGGGSCFDDVDKNSAAKVPQH